MITLSSDKLRIIQASCKDQEAFETVLKILSELPDHLSIGNNHSTQIQPSDSHNHKQHYGLFAFAGLISPEGRLIEISQEALDLMPVPVLDVLDQPFDQTYWWAYSDDVQVQLRMAMDYAGTGETLRYETVLRLSEDHYVTADFMLSPMLDAEQNVKYIIFSAIDVTERKLAEAALKASEARIRGIVESAVDGIITIDEHGIIDTFNPAAENLFGYSAGEVIGRNVKVLMPSPYQEEHDSYIRNYKETGQKKIIGLGREVIGKRKDGSEFPMQLAVSEFYLDRQRLFTGIIHDLTDRKQNEQRILELALEKARVNILSNFIRNASHEFRTPLSIISSSTYLLKKVNEPDKRNIHVTKINEQVRNITELVDALVTMSRLDSDVPFLREQINLNEIVQHVETSMRQAVQEKRLVITFSLDETLPSIIGDVGELGMALRHLLSNAIQFSPPYQNIRLCTFQDGAFVVVEIQDEGMGISEEELPRIFERFYRADRAHSTRGFGLGLPIAQKIVERHDGRITVMSESGKGSTFQVYLPIE